MLEKAQIPYGMYWSSPFCRWQGSLSGQHSIELAAHVAKERLETRGVDLDRIDGAMLGMTVPQRDSFYGAPWLAALIGAPTLPGMTVAQACATSARLIASAAAEVELGQRRCVLGVSTDRTSNGPHLYFPEPKAPGGRGRATDWVWDAFNRDPFANNAMVETAERVCKEAGFTREEQEEVTLLRDRQYRDSLADDRAFQKRYMAPVVLRRGKRKLVDVDGDEGVHESTAEGLKKLRPAMEGGTVTFGTQTHPADGTAGLLVCDADTAASLSTDGAVRIHVRAWGEARTDVGMMPRASVPAARAALEQAGLTMKDMKAVKTHNPFAANDLYFCREFGLELDAINHYGSPLVYGHPQAPMGTRVVVELIEELVDLGGGYGLFSGCAAGDTAMSLIVEVTS